MAVKLPSALQVVLRSWGKEHLPEVVWKEIGQHTMTTSTVDAGWV